MPIAGGVDVDAGVGDVGVVARADAALFREHRRAAAHVDRVPLGVVLGRADRDGLGGHEGIRAAHELYEDFWIASRCCW